MPSIVLRLRQKGYVRTSGYQTTQWAVTVPVSDPAGDPLLGTQPLSYAAFFVERNDGLTDTFVRVATLSDLVKIPHVELKYFDVLGPGGGAIFAVNPSTLVLGPFSGDVLRFPQAAIDGSLPYWLESDAPYTTGDFVVSGLDTRASGAGPVLLANNRLQLPGYNFTPNDINRWIVLSGFAAPQYNVAVQVINYLGSTAAISLTTAAGAVTGGAWIMPVIRIATSGSPTLEPRYFPTREVNTAWELRRGASVIGSAAYGGVTSRWVTDPTSSLTRSTRFTSLEVTPSASKAAMLSVQNGVMNLQAAATLNNTEIVSLITSTYGP